MLKNLTTKRHFKLIDYSDSDNFISSHCKKKTTLEDAVIQKQFSKMTIGKRKVANSFLGQQVMQPPLSFAFKIFESKDPVKTSVTGDLFGSICYVMIEGETF